MQGFRLSRTGFVLGGVLLLALLLRLRGLDFGLPALYDPDEPIFVLPGLKLLRDGTLNPSWFGHPGTQTIYALALVDIIVFAWHHYVTGTLADTAAFGRAIYTDPTIVFLPGRWFILFCGLATIALTFVLGRRLFDARVGLLAAALLAIDPIHIRYSQIIRTDMHATVFMLLVLLAATALATHGKRRHYVLAGVALGFAVATKWPAGAAAISVVGAAGLRWVNVPTERGQIVRGLFWFGIAALVGLFVASPYLFIDVTTVLDNLSAEKRPLHLGATGGGLFFNMAWYVTEPLRLALGVAGLALAAVGCWLGARRSPIFGAVVGTTAAAVFVSISAQGLIWERWAVPLLPLLTIALAVAIVAVAGLAKARAGQRGLILAAAVLSIAVVLPLARTGHAQAAERATDTRRLATDWARTRIAPGSSVAIEYLAFDVLSQPWRFVYPAGDDGCVDVRANLTGQIRISKVGKMKGARAVMNLSNVAPALLDTCRADWLIIANWDRYVAEAARYPDELAGYRRLIAGGTLAATFRPDPGRIGGPVVRVVRLPRQDR
ncbi:MAG: hypothetical protein JWN21_187 [Sphingomonas bacterium]|uniref:ArnT family glycosyltransferase n=1 Tax=Sphingomonas bacterium TaxID=1895847 RepID=UPI0026304A61|nr:glycosyltransferase family 39 protein [Sphingomonas bacterium]MDB5694644.1 hypothetical protein [Sphingomonas bacterium]